MSLQKLLKAAREYAAAVREMTAAADAARKELSVETAENFDLCEAFAERAKDVLYAEYDGLSRDAAAAVQFGDAGSLAEWAEKTF